MVYALSVSLPRLWPSDKMITNPFEFLLSIVAFAAVGIISLKANIIDKTGFVAAMFVGCSILIFGGWKWFIVLISFHFIAGLFTKYQYERKIEIGLAEKKGGARAWQNVLSNGVIASVLAICYGLTSLKIFAAGYLGAVSTSIADTLATELGVLNRDEPILITNPRVKVKAGVSGGVSLLGEVAALFGGSLIALVAFIVGFEGLSISQIFVFNILVGILGCNFDSLVGAVIQTAFKCQICGQVTEKKIHCERPTEYCRGIKFIDNNMVNVASTIFGALVAILSYSYIK